MEEKYAIQAKNVAFLLGFIAFIVFLFMLKMLLMEAPKESEYPQFFCGFRNRYSDTLLNQGKTLFINNCASCHAKSMMEPLTGPPLVDWKQHLKDEKELLFYLHNPTKYPKKRMNKEFRAMREIYTSARCMSFPNFTEADVAAIAAYIGGP